MSRSTQSTYAPTSSIPHTAAQEIADNRTQSKRNSTWAALSGGVASFTSFVLASSAAAQDAQPGVALPTIDVEGADGGGYRATGTSLSRIPTPLIDTPQAINVITPKIISEQRATTMEEALRNVTGITFNAGEGGRQGDAPILRGFESRGDMFRDGLRDPGWYTRDLFSTQSVEVYKGPSAFAFGRGATGGAINLVSKLPTGATFFDTTLSATTGPGGRVEFDAGGKSGNLSGRIAVMGMNDHTPDRDNVWTKRWGFAPSFTLDVTDRTKATLSYIYQGEESVPDYGHPWLPAPTANVTTGAITGGYFGNGAAVTPVPIPRANWFGFEVGPWRDLVDTDTHIVTGKIEHDFANGVKLANTTRYLSVDRMARPTAPRNLGLAGQLGSTATLPAAGYPVELMTIGRQHFQTDTTNTLLVNQTDLNAKFDTGGIGHTLSAGIELARETRFQERANLCNPTGAGACRTSLWAPDSTPAVFGTFTGFGAPNETEQTNIAAYASDQIKLNQYFELLGAVRLDRFDTDYTSGSPATTLSNSDTLFSWRGGAVFHPTPNSSIYVAYGNSYNPSAELGTLSNGNVSLDPEKNRSFEAGAKVDLLNNQLSLTASVFRTEKTNMRVANDPALPNNQQIQILDGLARVQGIELGAAGKITPQWQVFAGYTYLDTEIVESTNAAEVGKELPGAPPHSFSLWTTYDITPLWTVGGGAYYVSDTFANTTNTQYVTSYWRFDAMASYKVTPSATLQLNVYNITDEFYYAQYYQGHAVPAPGRSATLSLNMRF